MIRGVMIDMEDGGWQHERIGGQHGGGHGGRWGDRQDSGQGCDEENRQWDEQ